MLKKYLSNEEFGPTAESQDEDAVAEYILAEKEDTDAASEYADVVAQHEQLVDANEAWLQIMRSAIKNDAVTPHLRAGVEAHFNSVEHVLGELVADQIASLEFVQAETIVYDQETIASLEGVGRTLKRIGDRITKGFRRVFVDCNAYSQQKKAVDRLLTDFDQLRSKIESSDNESCAMDTSAQTNALSSAGYLPDDIPKQFAIHVKTVKAICTDYAPKAINAVKVLLDIFEDIGAAKRDDLDKVARRLASIKRPADFIKPDWINGKGFMNNCYLEPEVKYPKAFNASGSFRDYIRTYKDNMGVDWGQFKLISKPKDVTLTKKQALGLIGLVRQHLQDIKRTHDDLVDGEDQICYEAERRTEYLLEKLYKHERNKQLIKDSIPESKHKKALEVGVDVGMDIGFKSDGTKSQEAMLSILTNEFDWWMMPARNAIYNSIVVARALKAFLQRYK